MDSYDLLWLVVTSSLSCSARRIASFVRKRVLFLPTLPIMLIMAILAQLKIRVDQPIRETTMISQSWKSASSPRSCLVNSPKPTVKNCEISFLTFKTHCFTLLFFCLQLIYLQTSLRCLLNELWFHEMTTLWYHKEGYNYWEGYLHINIFICGAFMNSFYLRSFLRALAAQQWENQWGIQVHYQYIRRMGM